MSQAVLDDHLLRDLLSGELSDGLERVLVDHEPATTESLSGAAVPKRRVGHRRGPSPVRGPTVPVERWGDNSLNLPSDIEVVPVRNLAYRMAELADAHQLSTLGAEAVATSEHLSAPLCVWAGDDGPRIRSAMSRSRL